MAQLRPTEHSQDNLGNNRNFRARIFESISPRFRQLACASFISPNLAVVRISMFRTTKHLPRGSTIKKYGAMLARPLCVRHTLY